MAGSMTGSGGFDHFDHSLQGKLGLSHEGLTVPFVEAIPTHGGFADHVPRQNAIDLGRFSTT